MAVNSTRGVRNLKVMEFESRGNKDGFVNNEIDSKDSSEECRPTANSFVHVAHLIISDVLECLVSSK